MCPISKCEITRESPFVVGLTTRRDLTVEHHPLDEMGRQRNECYDISCDCLELSPIQEVPGLNQPYFLTHSENVGLWNEEVELSENDQDALDYTLEFFGASHARFEIDYGGIEPKLIHEIMEPEPE